MDEYMKVGRYRSIEEGLSELNRELNVRARCFPKWIKEGKTDKIDAGDRLDRLATVVMTLEAVMADDELAARVTALAELINANSKN